MKHYLLVNFFLLLIIFCVSFNLMAQVIALPNAHAHNDYKHKHPLTDAINLGFTSIEADIFLNHGNFIVSHLSPVFKKRKILELLYLKPLYDSITKRKGTLYKNYNEPIILLVDIKTNANETYNALKPLLEKYSSILTSYENGILIKRAVTIVLSGNKPYDSFHDETLRFAFIDENLMSEEKNKYDKNVCPLTSTKYSNILTWQGKGEIPIEEKQKLFTLTTAAHAQGKKVRLWASPENKDVWKELLNCGVDLLNTDDLKGLELFLLEANPIASASLLSELTK